MRHSRGSYLQTIDKCIKNTVSLFLLVSRVSMYSNVCKSKTIVFVIRVSMPCGSFNGYYMGLFYYYMKQTQNIAMEWNHLSNIQSMIAIAWAFLNHSTPKRTLELTFCSKMATPLGIRDVRASQRTFAAVSLSHHLYYLAPRSMSI